MFIDLTVLLSFLHFRKWTNCHICIPAVDLQTDRVCHVNAAVMKTRSYCLTTHWIIMHWAIPFSTLFTAVHGWTNFSFVLGQVISLHFLELKAIFAFYPSEHNYFKSIPLRLINSKCSPSKWNSSSHKQFLMLFLCDCVCANLFIAKMCLTLTGRWQRGGHFTRIVELVCACAAPIWPLTLGKDRHGPIFVWTPLPGAVPHWIPYIFRRSLLQWLEVILRLRGESKGWRFERTMAQFIDKNRWFFEPVWHKCLYFP